MRTISVTDIVDFKRKSKRSRQTFALNVKLGADEIRTESRGNYWSRSISAVSNSFKSNDLQPVKDKKKELITLLQTADSKRQRDNYEKNIEILATFEDMDSGKLRPEGKLVFQKKNKKQSILTIKGIGIKVNPSHIFTFQQDREEQIGGIWFIAKKDGLRKDELGMYTDILYKYLNTHYSEKYPINISYCIAVDLFNGTDISYLQLKEGEISRVLNQTIDELIRLM